MQTFFKSDPISEGDQLAIQNHLDDQLTELIAICKKHLPKILIGSAGAFESFAGMIHHDIAINRISTANIDYEEYKKLALTLINANHQERAKIEGLIPLRVDMIVMAALLTNYVLEKLDIKKLTLSTYDLKIGVLKELSAGR